MWISGCKIILSSSSLHLVPGLSASAPFAVSSMYLKKNKRTNIEDRASQWMLEADSHPSHWCYRWYQLVQRKMSQFFQFLFRWVSISRAYPWCPLVGWSVPSTFKYISRWCLWTITEFPKRFVTFETFGYPRLGAQLFAHSFTTGSWQIGPRTSWAPDRAQLSGAQLSRARLSGAQSAQNQDKVKQLQGPKAGPKGQNYKLCINGSLDN